MSGVRFATKDELVPLNPRLAEEDGDEESEDDDDDDERYEEKEEDENNTQLPAGYHQNHQATTRAQGFTKQESMKYHFQALRSDLTESFRSNFQAYRNQEPSIRSKKRAKLNFIFGGFLLLTVLLLLAAGGLLVYKEIYLPRHKQHQLEHAIFEHAEAAHARTELCRGFDWKMACDNLGPAGARRRTTTTTTMTARDLYTGRLDRSKELEDEYLFSDDPTVTYDENCLRVYRLELFGNVTFPYHAGQLLSLGGNYTMALFIQHGAMRNAQDYFCSFKQLMQEQNYRNFEDILIIAPNFNYEHDELVHPRDAFWNTSKPWGDWRVGAESDPRCCGNQGHSGDPRTISSFEVLDNLLATLTNKELFPRMNKISYVGHSAGGQMVQRYAVMSILAALWDLDEDVDMAFIIANPSSYTYLTDQRYHYACTGGTNNSRTTCACNTKNCTCDGDCTAPPYTSLAHPTRGGAEKGRWPCYQWNYNRWPYGLGSFSDKKGHYVPYSLRDGLLGTTRAVRLYEKLHVVYMVGQNDTCNDGLPTCDSSCWKRDNWEEGEWQCYRNHMDSRCPAMLQGPNRRTRGHQYMNYLEDLYGRPTHTMHTIPGVGHDATAMFGSDIGMKELFGP